MYEKALFVIGVARRWKIYGGNQKGYKVGPFACSPTLIVEPKWVKQDWVERITIVLTINLAF